MGFYQIDEQGKEHKINLKPDELPAPVPADGEPIEVPEPEPLFEVEEFPEDKRPEPADLGVSAEKIAKAEKVARPALQNKGDKKRDIYDVTVKKGDDTLSCFVTAGNLREIEDKLDREYGQGLYKVIVLALSTKVVL